MSWGGRPTLWGQQDTDVPCPRCPEGFVWVRISCLGVSAGCRGCGATYELGDLARALDDETFSRLEQLLGGRFSDRV